MLTKLLINRYVTNSDFKSPEARKQFGVLSGTVGIICNLILSVGKFIAGVMTGSIAISADAFNNLSDAISSIVTLICFRTSDSPADREHPFGHGRIEYISGLIVSIAIIFMGIEFIKSSIEKIFNPEPVVTSTLPVVILAASLVVKLWLSYFNRKIGNMIDSTAIKAAAFDSISDSVVTITILIGMSITYFTGLYVDAYSGIIVACFVILTGLKMIKESTGPLLGQAPDPELVKSINNLVMKCPDILGIHELAVHNYGPGRLVISMHAEVPANRNIMELHDSIDEVENKLKNKFKCQATIHMDPIVTDDKQVTDMKEKLSALIKLIDQSAQIYDLRIVPGKSKTLIFQVSIPYDLPETDKQLKKSIQNSIDSIEPGYDCIINIDRVYFDSQV
ncbi:MAG: cation transporter [Clostridia bacterium]|nr:cation transporter [Clostridia bacterium]MBR2735438.1 cation transporter [Clostridia bacterium]